MGRRRCSRGISHPVLTPFAMVVRIRMKREYFRRMTMLKTRKSTSAVRVPDSAAGTGSRDVTELLLGVLRSIEPYEACILEAERDGDLEVAAFLRELRRQDLARAREATRLLRRSLEAAYANVGKEREPYVELSAGP